ncbi:MAG: MoxR family ATPase [Deltaproteobacteria bacterium]|nr:MoxR family ATPase [Deltaproteobacteria bacterium]
MTHDTEHPTLPEAARPAVNDLQQVELLHRAVEDAKAAIGRRIIGQREVVEHLLIALFSNGHALFVGVPGLAKTLLIQTLAEVLDLGFNRIQFTPDLMPSDVTGTDVLEQDPQTGRRSFRFVKGPIFTNLLLADEINRTPPKTQAALLQAMQEHQVTASGATHRMPDPFHVFATQNPIEQEGTYPLPEAQLDRFMFMLDVRYPAADEEVEIVRSTTGEAKGALPKVLSPERILALQALVRRVPAPESVVKHAVSLVRSTRPDSVDDHVSGAGAQRIREFVSFGAGPRASQYLVLGAKARAAMMGRPSATVEDVRALAVPVLAHRVVTNFHAEASGVRPADLVRTVLESVRG